MDCLVQAGAFIEAFCARHGVDRRDALRLTLLTEELFTNTVEHGPGGERRASVRLSLRAGPARLTLLYADTAPPFDPLAWLAQGVATRAVDDDDLADRPVGQLGLLLVAQLAARAHYERRDGWNRLQLDLERHA